MIDTSLYLGDLERNKAARREADRAYFEAVQTKKLLEVEALELNRKFFPLGHIVEFVFLEKDASKVYKAQVIEHSYLSVSVRILEHTNRLPYTIPPQYIISVSEKPVVLPYVDPPCGNNRWQYTCTECRNSGAGEPNKTYNCSQCEGVQTMRRSHNGNLYPDHGSFVRWCSCAECVAFHESTQKQGVNL